MKVQFEGGDFSTFEIKALRVYAGFCFCLCCLLAALNGARFNDQNAVRGLGFLYFSFSVNLLCSCIATVLLVKPKYWQLWLALHLVQAVKTGVWGGECLSVLFYLMGWAIALRAGFFRRALIPKIIIAALGFILILAIQIKVGAMPFLIELLRFGVFGAMLALTITLFVKAAPKPYIDGDEGNEEKDIYAPQESGAVISLSRFHFDYTEEYCIYAVLGPVHTGKI